MKIDDAKWQTDFCCFSQKLKLAFRIEVSSVLSQVLGYFIMYVM